MNLTQDIGKFLASLREQGLATATRRAWQSVQARSSLSRDLLFDQQHGVETSELAQLSELTIASSNREQGTSYYPTPVTVLRWILRQLPETEGFNFIDLGSGRGRGLLVAAAYPFRRLIGVEFADELHESAPLIYELVSPAESPVRGNRLCAG